MWRRSAGPTVKVLVPQASPLDRGYEMTTDALDYARSTLIAEYQAVENSIEIVKLRQRGDHTVVAARFTNGAGRQARAMLGMREFDGRWHGTGGFGGGDNSADEANVSWSSGGWSHGPRIVRGFWVEHASAVALRLTDTAAGRVHEDNIERGVAILMWDGDFDQAHARVELTDTQGDVVKTGPVWPAPSLID